MGFLRRGGKDQKREVPPGLHVPEGMVAVHHDEMDQWAERLVDEASEAAVTRPASPWADLYAKVALGEVCGRERFRSLPGGTGLLGYNLVLLGYWCRSVELDAVDASDASPGVTDFLRGLHDRQAWGDEWFVTLTGASRLLARVEEGGEELAEAIRNEIPAGLGRAFRDRYQVVASMAVVATITAQHPGADDPLTSTEMVKCWRLGYFLRALEPSLPDEGVAELAQQAASNR